MKHVVFQLGDIEFGVPIDQVQSIESTPTVTELPNAPSYIRGTMDFRSEVIPVLDFNYLLLRKHYVESEHTCIITIQHHTQSFGALVDTTKGVVDISVSTIQQPKILKQYAIPFLSGIANLPNRLLLLIDMHSWLEQFSCSPLFDIQSFSKTKSIHARGQTYAFNNR